MCIGLILRISIGIFLWVKFDTKYLDYFIDICALVLSCVPRLELFMGKTRHKISYFIDMICALILSCVSRLQLFVDKIRHKNLDYFIEMIEYAVLQEEFVSKCYLPNLRFICLFKIF